MATAAPLAGGSAPSWSSDRRAFRRYPSGWFLGALVAFLTLLSVAAIWAIVAKPAVVRVGGFPIFLFPGFLFGLLFLFWVAWAVVRWSIRPYWRWHGAALPYGPWGSDPAVSIARQRYARGEISREEFGALVNDLNRSEGRT